jgi:hypothetical protein
MDALMGWSMVVEGLLLSAVLALALTWSALRAVFHLMPATAPAARRAVAPQVSNRAVAQQTSARAA